MSQRKPRQAKTPQKIIQRSYRTRNSCKIQIYQAQSNFDDQSQNDQSETITNNSIFQQIKVKNSSQNYSNHKTKKVQKNQLQIQDFQFSDETQNKEKQYIRMLQDYQKKPLQQELDYQIQRFLESYFRTSKIPNIVILTAKKLLLQQIQKLLSKSLHKFVIIHNKSQLFNLSFLLKTIQNFDDKYKNKIVRSFMLQAIQATTKTKN